jgi:hypothetical protein
VIRLPYTPVGDAPTSLMPHLPLTLSLRSRAVDVVGLLDTGSAVNILPYAVGLALGAVWDEQVARVPLVGSLGSFEARALVTLASHPQLTPSAPVRLVFAWSQSDDVPIIFGKVNVFMEFDVCFYRFQETFEVALKGTKQSTRRGQSTNT